MKQIVMKMLVIQVRDLKVRSSGRGHRAAEGGGGLIFPLTALSPAEEEQRADALRQAKHINHQAEGKTERSELQSSTNRFPN